MSLREVARRAGVSHTSASHHFGSRMGLLTAIASEGYTKLAQAMLDARSEHDFLEVGVAYVQFAVANPASFDVMFRPDLHDPDDEELRKAKAKAADALYGRHPGSRPPQREQIAGAVAAWSIVHGLANLLINGNIPTELGSDPAAITREVSSHLSPLRR